MRGRDITEAAGSGSGDLHLPETCRGALGFVRGSPASGPATETTFHGLANAGVPEVTQ